MATASGMPHLLRCLTRRAAPEKRLLYVTVIYMYMNQFIAADCKPMIVHTYVSALLITNNPSHTCIFEFRLLVSLQCGSIFITAFAITPCSN